MGGPDGVRMHPICVKLHRSVHAPEISAEKPCEKFRILVERETFVEKESIHLFFPDQCQEERQFSGESVTEHSMSAYYFIGHAVVTPVRCDFLSVLIHIYIFAFYDICMMLFSQAVQGGKCVWRKPEIIGIDKYNILAFSPFETIVLGGSRAVVLFVEYSYSMVVICIFVADGARRILASVIYEKQFKIFICLSENAFYSGMDVFFSVI